jgi:hypothetical protein
MDSTKTAFWAGVLFPFMAGFLSAVKSFIGGTTHVIVRNATLLKRIKEELIGKKIKSVKVFEGNTPSVELEFEGGTSWSFVAEPKPNVEMMFSYSDADGDSIRAVLDGK